MYFSTVSLFTTNNRQEIINIILLVCLVYILDQVL